MGLHRIDARASGACDSNLHAVLFGGAFVWWLRQHFGGHECLVEFTTFQLKRETQKERLF
jgi:hypothetical protein